MEISTSGSKPAGLGPTLATSTALASVGGALVALQISFNGALGSAGAGPILAAWTSYAGTLAFAVLFVIVLGKGPEVFRIIRFKAQPWWFLVGLSGVPIVISTAWGAPILGVAISAICSIGGQTIAGLLLDSKGVGLKKRIPLKPRRILAGLVAITGLATALGPGISELKNPLAALALGVAIFISGMLLSLQNAGNGAVAGLSGHPFVPMITSVIGGTFMITSISLVLSLSGATSGTLIPQGVSWWMYLGGPAGMGIVLCATIAVRTLGTFGLTLLMVVGQMTAAVIIDLILTGTMDWASLGASAVMVLATLLAVTPKKKQESVSAT